VPKFLDLLENKNLRITFFIVGQDASHKKNQEVIQAIADHGHEIGNHTYYHEPWLAFERKGALKEELIRSSEILYQVTSKMPKGFRGPGFTWSPKLLSMLKELRYHYSSTLLPTFYGPFLRLYCYSLRNLSPKQKERRKKLFGSFRNGFRPQTPFWWEKFGKKLVMEIPVSTIPLCRFPFHMSYLISLYALNPKLMRMYLTFALSLCKCRDLFPNFLIHPTDLLGGDVVPEMRFFPGMRLSTEEKTAVLEEVIETLQKAFPIKALEDRYQVHQHEMLKRVSI